MKHYLIRVKWARLSGGLDCTETASPRAGVPHQHDGSSGSVAICSSPAFPYVWAACLLTHCAQIQLAQVALDLGELVSPRQCPLEPVRLPGFFLQ